MAFFSYFPKIEYDVRGDGSMRVMTNLTRRTRFRDYIRLNAVTYDFYDVKGGETPEYIANEYYGDPELHWIILMANNIVDYYTQWPMTVPTFEEYVKEKYDDANGIHHYEYSQESGDTTKIIELPNESATTIPAGATIVTNYVYEERIQENNRRIRLIQPRFIDGIKKEFKNLMNG